MRELILEKKDGKETIDITAQTYCGCGDPPRHQILTITVHKEKLDEFVRWYDDNGKTAFSFAYVISDCR